MAAIPSVLVSAASPQRDSLVLLLMKGHPGSGKSTLARSLARSLRWPLVDKDVFRDATMLLERPDGPGAAPVDARVLNSLSYDAMWQMAEVQLDLGLSVVVDCPLAHEALFKAGMTLSTRVGAKIALIECHVSDLDTWKRRIQSRAAAALSDGQPSENIENCAEGCRPSVSSVPCVGGEKGICRSPGDREIRFRDSQGARETISGSSQGAGEMDSSVKRPSCGNDASVLERGGESESERKTGSESESKSESESERQQAAGSLKGRWHKPACWEDMQELLDRYNGCWTYPTGSVPKLTIDTGIVGPDEALAMAMGWLVETALVIRKD